MMTTLELVQYYANLLILQYLQKPKAYATVEALASLAILPQVSTQDITFSAVSASGTFILIYNGNPTAAINWNDSLATIQSKLQAVSGLSTATVSGSIAGELLTITFNGVTPPANLIEIGANSLEDGASNPITLSVAETDVTLPIAVQNAFGINTAVGNQLDVIGKYVGVTRNGNTFSGSITLDDSDFAILIQLAVFQNNAGSSLADIQNLIANFFPGQILVFDYTTMRISYFLSVGSKDLIQMILLQHILPKPMGVQLGTTIYAPIINAFFGFRTYELPGTNNSPFNTYAVYSMVAPWLTYADALIV